MIHSYLPPSSIRMVAFLTNFFNFIVTLWRSHSDIPPIVPIWSQFQMFGNLISSLHRTWRCNEADFFFRISLGEYPSAEDMERGKSSSRASFSLWTASVDISGKYLPDFFLGFFFVFFIILREVITTHEEMSGSAMLSASLWFESDLQELLCLSTMSGNTIPLRSLWKICLVSFGL